LEKKGGEILRNYEKQGKKEKAEKLRKKLRNALVFYLFLIEQIKNEKKKRWQKIN